ncbi:MAG: type II toxin-antitoxin system RelE/ParE family toxin [Candidatus Omnitrophica bacterium]|nr:type II toxin-antitoxin system RelE/ParE family toxin [Candidatus Omnitrophota bacterium]
MITSFGDKATEDVFNGVLSKKALGVPRDIWPVARRKLDMVNAAHELRDLKAPAGNRLELLRGSLKEFYSIRINDQYRVVFKWTSGNAEEVRIADYH